MAAPIPAAVDCVTTRLTAKRRRALAELLLGTILVATLCLKLNHLDHTALTHWDEVFHAVVAQNVARHPLTPTLVDAVYLPYDYRDWRENHVWLHKPILPFWQIALSFTVLGVSAFTLRLPSALLSTAAAWLTYRIGAELLERRAALVAAALQAVSPFLMTLVHGYQFADHIDMALLFWVEVGVYFLIRSLRTGSWYDVVLAGMAQGLAFLCKSYLAGIVLGIALTAWLLPWFGAGQRTACRLTGARILGLLGATLALTLPWQLYCSTRFPQEFAHEHAQLWKHLVGNVEGWAAPWDRVVFDYLIALYGVFYTPILVAIPLMLGKAVLQRHTGLCLLLAWSVGVLAPHLLAGTKTPSATLLALPPLFLLLGALVSEASRGQRGPLAALTGVLAMSIFVPPVIKPPGYGFPSSRAFGVLMERAPWVIDHVAAALAFALVVGCAAPLLHESSRLGRCVRVGTQVFCAVALTWLTVQTVQAAWTVTAANECDPVSVEVGAFARSELPANAVLLCEEPNGYDHLTVMFYAERTCYPLVDSRLDELAARVARAGGAPFIVASRRLPFAVVHVCRNRGPTLYRWEPAR